MHMENITNKELWREKNITKETKVLVAVSWGPDSMYLLWMMKDFFQRKWYPHDHLHIVSCDHQTRSDIDQEMKTVREYSKPYKRQCIQYYWTKTTENTLRQWRHWELVNYAKKEHIWLIHLGHHLNDRIETTLMHIQQGCGWDGFRGMSIEENHFLDQNIRIVRPLLYMTKSNIIQKCQENNIPYHIDPSNNDANTSQRNGLRQKLTDLSKDNNREKSRKKIYKQYDKERVRGNISTKIDTLWWCYYNQSHEWDTWILQVEPEWRTEELLYQVYQRHGKSIRPRWNTLSRLSEQLHHSNASIDYQWISIQSKKYISIIKVKE